MIQKYATGILGNADAGIGDCDFCDTPAVRFTRLLAEGTGDRPALGGIFDRIAQKIYKNLTHLQWITQYLFMPNPGFPLKLQLFLMNHALHNDIHIIT